MAQEYDKLFKLVALVFINAIMRLSNLEPGIVSIEYPEIFTEDTDRGIMDFPVLTRMGYYIIFEFHSSPLDEIKLLRNFQYLANLRARVKYPVDLIIISTEKIKKSVKSVAITPDWNFEPKFSFIIDLDGDEILNNIKNKLENNIALTDEDAYLFSVLPFTKHQKDTVEWVEELCYFVNEIELSEEHKYIIKLSQILWVEALIKDENLSKILMGVIKMRNNFLIEYERELIESAVESAVESALESAEQKNNEKTAKKMLEMDYPPEDILEITGIDVLKM